MNTDTLMIVLGIVAGIGFAGYAGIHLLGRKHPTASRPLPVRALLGYYGAALGILRRHRWLVWIPIALYLPVLVWNTIYLAEMTAAPGMAVDSPFSWSVATLGLRGHLMLLSGAASAVTHGYLNALFFNFISMLLALVVFIITPIFLARIRYRIGGGMPDGLRAMGRILRPCMWFGIPILLIAVLAWANEKLELIRIVDDRYLAIFFYGAWVVLAVPVVLILSFGEGVLLATLRGHLRGKMPSLACRFDDALAAVVPLFLLNLAITYLFLLRTLLSLFGVMLDPAIFPYAYPVAALLLVTLPFEILASGASLRLALRRHAAFLLKHALPYITFVGFAVATRYAGSLVTSTAGDFQSVIPSVAGVLIDLGMTVFLIALNAVIFIAAYAFYLDRAEAEATAVPQGADAEASR